MPTISSMLKGTYLMYKYNQKNGNSIFNSSSSSYKSGINSLWNNYNANSASRSASSTLSGLIGIRSNVNELVSNYNTTRKTFDTEFTETVDKLKKSSDTVKRLNFKVSSDALTITETTNEDGTTSTTSNMSDDLAEAVKGVKDFAESYNDAIKFFSDNSSVSRQVKYMAASFSDTTYNAGSASNIGIKIDSSGKMTVDEETLAKSITDNFTRVKAVMSTLTNKSDRHVSFAKSQKSRMFPTIQSMLGGSLKSASVYSGRSLSRLSNYSNLGSLLNYFV